MFQPFASTASLARHPGLLSPFYRAGSRSARPAGREDRAGPSARSRHDPRRVEAAAWCDDAAPDEADPMTQMALADAADASLMRLVLCAASATLALALVSSLL